MWYIGEEEANVQHTGEVLYMVETFMLYWIAIELHICYFFCTCTTL